MKRITLLIFAAFLTKGMFAQNVKGKTGTVTDYDSNTYKTIKIGKQWWMAENLKVTHYDDGTAIPLVTSDTAWASLGDNSTDKAYCYQNNNANGEKDTYGALYTWAAAMNGANSSEADPSGVQGVCPTGWHLPSDKEWKQLEMYLGMSKNESEGLRFRGTNQGSKLAGNASLWAGVGLKRDPEFGSSGFSALPGGSRMDTDGKFIGLHYMADWWTTSWGGSSDAVNRNLHTYRTTVYSYYHSKSRGHSVRCVKD